MRATSFRLSESPGTQIDRPLVLDTHVWVWLANGDSRLERSPARESIERAAQASTLLLSAISVWEVAMLVSKGRLHFGVPLEKWVDQALTKTRLKLVDLLPAISIDSTALPGDFHGDPADRIIVATARHVAGTIVTADRAIVKYGRSWNASVLAVAQKPSLTPESPGS